MRYARVRYAQLIDSDPSTIEMPDLTEPIDLAIAASIVELVASRKRATPPAWTSQVAALPEPYVLVTVRLPEKLERLCRESPPELRHRNLVAPESFLLTA